MYKRCKPPSEEKWTSASHDLVTCGKKCWISIKALQAVIARTHWTASCVRPVKPPQLPNAAHANVVHQALLAIQAETAKMVTPEPMAKQEAQELMLDLMKNLSSQFHPNATATLHQAAQANQDQKDPMVAQAMLEHQAVMDNQEPKDHQAHQAQLAKPELTDPKDPQERQEPKEKVPQAQQDQQAKPELQVPQDQLAQPAVQAKMVVLALQVPQEMQAVQVLLANPVPQVLQEKMVPQVPLALALTAHQLVWLQVIKRSSGHSNITTTSSISYSSVTLWKKNFVPTSFLFQLNIVSHQ